LKFELKYASINCNIFVRKDVVKMLKIQDTMQREVDYVTTDTKIQYVASLIFGRKINGVPVVEGKKIVGFITERDILKQFFPSIQEVIEDPVKSKNYTEMERKIPEIFDYPASKIMSKKPIVINSEEPILKALSIMFVNKIGRLPVVDQKSNLLGIVTKGDIFRALVGDSLPLYENEEDYIWFSTHYRIFYNWKARLLQEIPDLVKTLKKNKAEKVIDLGCGTGEHSIALAQKGFEVVGIEKEEILINEANMKKAKLPKKIQEKVSFKVGDYQEVLDQLENNFDAAIFMGNSISYNPDNYREIIGKTAEKLNKKAVMIFQITNFEKVLKEQSRVRRMVFAKTEGSKEHSLLEFYNPSNDHGKSVLKTTALFQFDGKSWNYFGLKNTIMAYITNEKIKAVLKKIDFEDISLYGSTLDHQKWDKLFKKPFEVSKSDFLNIIAKR